MEAAGKAWSACKLNISSTNAECKESAKRVFEKVSGSTDQASWDAAKGQVEKLGIAKADGKHLAITYKKEIDVDGRTSATECSEKLESDFRNKLIASLVTKMYNNG